MTAESDRTTILLAIPSTDANGLEAERSAHFGRSEYFTLVELAEDSIASIRVIENMPHEQGGCMGPVQLLADNGVEALVVAGIGGRPLAGCAEAGITVYHEDTLPRVGEAVVAFLAGAVDPIDPGAGCGCHH